VNLLLLTTPAHARITRTRARGAKAPLLSRSQHIVLQLLSDRCCPSLPNLTSRSHFCRLSRFFQVSLLHCPLLAIVRQAPSKTHRQTRARRDVSKSAIAFDGRLTRCRTKCIVSIACKAHFCLSMGAASSLAISLDVQLQRWMRRTLSRSAAVDSRSGVCFAHSQPNINEQASETHHDHRDGLRHGNLYLPSFDMAHIAYKKNVSGSIFF
jgi:hypothetical protein